jgi:adenosylhomocysteine nucleosidase
VFLVVALQAEAQPLITRFGLRCESPRGMFRIYRSESMALVVSGVGKSLSAAATGYLCGCSDGWRNAPWINIGVAGHRNVDVGELIVANKIVDQSTAHSWYPPQLVSNVDNSTLITVDKPEESYPERAAYDMEAAGFFPSATRCSSGELVQSIKVISDNPHQSIASLNARSIEQLITKNLSEIEQFIHRLSELSIEIKVLPHNGSLPELWANRWSFSVTQGHRLRRLLQRWKVLIGDGETLDSVLGACKDGAAVLTALEARLNAEKPTYRRSLLVGPRASSLPDVQSQ